MFIGHYAVAFAAKKASPKISLGTLFIAAQLIDLIWPVLLLFGIEHVKVEPGNTAVTPLNFYDYPITHSLLGVLIWSVLMLLFYLFIRRDVKDALIVGFCVFSHWLLDLITHKPDLPLAPGSDKMFGLGLWNSIQGTIIVEAGFFVFAVYLYFSITKAKDKAGNYGFWSLVILLLIIYFANIFGSAPPDETVLPYVGLLTWIFVPWAYWIEKHRTITE
jgi:membrane-bound metal-dependent hydrolase YbcI (DUF457 family)